MNFEKLRNLSEGNFITPMGINPGNNIRSLSLTNNEIKKDNNEDNNIINIPFSKTLNPETQNYKNLFGNNELNIDKGGDNEEYDAPPSINQNL